MSGMAERSRRPQGHAGQLGQEEVCEIIRLKQPHRHWGPRKIRQLYLRQHGQAPDEVWTVDFKGWWYDAAGQRCGMNTADIFWS